MDGRPGRALRAGMLVCFLAEDDDELLWTARMTELPKNGETCTDIVGEVETPYKVESKRWEFLHEDVGSPIGYIDGVPQYGDFVPSLLTHVGAIVIVSEL